MVISFQNNDKDLSLLTSFLKSLRYREKYLGKIDDIDIKILTELIKDASLSVPRLSKKINVNSSVVYSRIKRLIKRNIIKRFTAEINEEKLGYFVTVVTGLNIDSRFSEMIMKDLTELPEVRQIIEVTGRFDLIVEAKSRSLEELHEVVSSKIGRIKGVLHTETFIEMKKIWREQKYVLPNVRA